MSEVAPQAWLAVVSAEHVARGVSLGIAQVNHGKRAPLARMRAGDTLVYYSPTTTRGVADSLKTFTALGVFPDDDVFQADEGSFKPFRRKIDYATIRPVPLADVRSRLHLTSTPGWGHQLRFGLLKLEAADVATLREAMGL